MILTFQDSFWNIFSFTSVFSWMGEPFGFESYEDYTNPKFRMVEKSDSFFLQRTKEYFFLNIPVVLITFLILNRLFYCLF